jgi:SpoVK/Ycf46/Vps4 family AAA+-type ATPase
VRRWTLWFDVERGTEPPQVAGETPPGSRSGKRWGRPVEVVPLSEVREALLVAVQNEDAILDQRLADAVHQVRQASQPETLDESVQSLLELSLEITLEAALPSADSEGQG